MDTIILTCLIKYSLGHEISHKINGSIFVWSKQKTTSIFGFSFWETSMTLSCFKILCPASPLQLITRYDLITYLKEAINKKCVNKDIVLKGGMGSNWKHNFFILIVRSKELVSWKGVRANLKWCQKKFFKWIFP